MVRPTWNDFLNKTLHTCISITVFHLQVCVAYRLNKQQNVGAREACWTDWWPCRRCMWTFQSRWQYSITCYNLDKLQSSPVLKKQIVLLACTSVIVSACLSTHSNSTHSNSTAVLLSHIYSQTIKWLHGDVTNSCLIPSLWMAWEWGKISLCSLA